MYPPRGSSTEWFETTESITVPGSLADRNTPRPLRPAIDQAKSAQERIEPTCLMMVTREHRVSSQPSASQLERDGYEPRWLCRPGRRAVRRQSIRRAFAERRALRERLISLAVHAAVVARTLSWFLLTVLLALVWGSVVALLTRLISPCHAFACLGLVTLVRG